MTSNSLIDAESIINGRILSVNKPKGWTSFDVVGKVRTLFRYYLGIEKIKVGHAGTLDPLAVGLLLLCTGTKTKEIEKLQELEKTYTGVMVLGATTPSYDLETAIDRHFPYNHIRDEDILTQTAFFKGTIQQIPPLYSAIKVKGKRAYKYARSQQPVELTPRSVTLYDFAIEKIELPRIFFMVRCSKGTYIRSLARDFGQSLGTGAYLESLCRTAIGPYRLEDALQIEEIESLLGSSQFN